MAYPTENSPATSGPITSSTPNPPFPTVNPVGEQPFPNYPSTRDTCGFEGKAVMWGNNAANLGALGWSNTAHPSTTAKLNNAGQTYTFTATLTINPATGDAHPFCIRGHLANWFITEEVARSTNYGCFQEVTSGLNGNVLSDPNVATGKRFSSGSGLLTSDPGGTNLVRIAPVNFSLNSDGTVNTASETCDWNPADDVGVETDSSGAFSYQWVVGQPYCIGPPGYDGTSITPITYDGTTYNNIQLSGNKVDKSSGSLPAVPTNDAYGWNNFDTVQQCGATVGCGHYNFYWLPTGSPNFTLTENSPGNGANLKPGDAVSYTVTIDNPYDYNINYNTSGGFAALADYVPNNIDPASITGGPGGASIGLSPDPSGHIPFGWTVNGVIPCFSLNYGYAWSPNQDNLACNNGGGLEALSFNELPAYSKVSFSWVGRVKSAANVGVYPEYFQSASDQAHAMRPNCNNNYGNSTSGLISGCEDFANGLEGVYNVAGFYVAVAADGSTENTWTPSQQYYNPIPAGISCISKYVNPTGLQQDIGNQTTIADCNNGQQPQYWSYDPTLPQDNHGGMVFQVQPNASAGPLWYQLYDQNSSTGVNSNMAVQTGVAGGSGTLAGSTCTAGCNGGQGALVNWGVGNNGDEVAGSGDTGLYNFNFSLANATSGAGSSFSNVATACAIEYWMAPSGGVRPTACAQSQPMYFTQYTDTSPYVTSSGGNVHAGGCSQSATSVAGVCTSAFSATCPTNPGGLGNSFAGGNNGIFNNNPSTDIGSYFVTAGDNISGNPFNGSSGKLPTANGVGVILRPNLCASADAYVQKQGQILAGTNIFSPGQNGPSGGFNDSAMNVGGKVISAVPSAGGTYTLGNADGQSPANITINHRWTLYVKGNLYINANIAYGQPSILSPSGAESNHPSFGVIVTGNIYIAKDVTNLSGFYVSSKVLNTCAHSSGQTLAYGNEIPDVPPYNWYSVTECDNPLTVDGLLYADTFRFNRTYGYNNPSPTASEQINYDNRLYTATPPAFEALVSSSLLSKYLVEPLPRY